jgi:hypothetical protein
MSLTMGELMDIMFMGPWSLFLLAFFVLMIVAVASSNRRHEPPVQDRSCPRCGAVHPSFANYCARCGHELE